MSSESEPSEFIVRTTQRVEIAEERIGEYVEANFDDEEVVIENPETGRRVFQQNEFDEYRCPVCGKDAYSIGTWDGRDRWFHGDQTEPCRRDISVRTEG